MKVRRKIGFTGKNLNDMFILPCVKSIMKDHNGLPVLLLYLDSTNNMRNIAPVGSILIQYDDGHWEVEAGKSKFNSETSKTGGK